MPVEVSCGSCQGRFLVAVAGTVACPHCGIRYFYDGTKCGYCHLPPEVSGREQALEDRVDRLEKELKRLKERPED